MANEHGKHGFGTTSDEKQRDAASKGGKASHGGQGSQSSQGKESKNAGSRSGSDEQHSRAGEQSHKNR